MLAMDGSLLSAALRAFVGAIFALQRRTAKRLGIRVPRPRAVGFEVAEEERELEWHLKELERRAPT